MTPSVNIDELKLGMFVHLDLGWWAHPFALSSFVITSPEQIHTIRALGLKRLRWSPEKSQTIDPARPEDAREGEPGRAGAPADASAAEASPAAGPDGPGARAAAAASEPAQEPAALARQHHQQALAAQRQAEHQCAAQLAEARAAWLQASQCLGSAPAQARQIAQGLAEAVVAKLMGKDELAVRVLADDTGEPQASHALNVMVVALMMGRVCGLGEAEMRDLGLGALLHDIGKQDLSPLRRHLQPGAADDDIAAYRSHVALGVAQGQRMGLGAGVMQVIAQHHELADGSGFPQGLTLDGQGRAARIVALVNRYDNLCHPPAPAQGLTPHDALAVLFAQSRNRFDPAVLNSFIRMMGVYPPGSVVQLTDERYASVVSVNSARPLKPRVLVADLAVPAHEALLLDLDQQTDLGIRRSLKPAQLPAAVRDYLDPKPRMAYYFEPAPRRQVESQEALAA
jgi:putative nucleotidyltransferase with HDIG domain